MLSLYLLAHLIILILIKLHLRSVECLKQLLFRDEILDVFEEENHHLELAVGNHC